MRKIAHQILTGLPAFVIAMLGLWAAASPTEAAEAYAWFVSVMQYRLVVAGAFVAVLAYAVVWWLTSIEPKTRREKIVEGLRPLRDEMWTAYQGLQTTDWENLETHLQNCQTAANKVADYVSKNMSSAAHAAFNYPSRPAVEYRYKGSPSGEARDKRSNTQSGMEARLKVLEKFLENSAYDGEVRSS